MIDEHKLKVVYTSPTQSGNGNSEGESGLASAASGRRGSDVRPTLTYLFNVFFSSFPFKLFDSLLIANVVYDCFS